MKEVENIYFFNPTHNVGGNETVFLQIYKQLSNFHKELNLYLIDYENGEMVNFFSKQNVKFNHIVFSENGSDITLSKNSVVLIASHLMRIVPGGKMLLNHFNCTNISETKFLFWNIDSSSYILLFKGCWRVLTKIGFIKFQKYITPLLPILFTQYFKIQNAINIALSKNGYVFMSSEDYSTLNKVFKIKQKPQFLPICVSPSNVIKKRFKNSVNNLHFCWLGRLEGSKYYSAINTVRQLNKWSKNTSNKATIIIIGKGDKFNNLKNDLSSFKDIEIKIIEGLYGEDLNTFLIKEVDILFAVGTSMLEGCKLSIPTAFSATDFNNVDMKKFTFFLKKSENGFLGGYGNSKNNPLIDIFELMEVYKKEGASNIANTSYKLFIKNFHVQQVTEKFLEYVNKSDLTLEDLKKTGIYDNGILSGKTDNFIQYIKK